MARAAPIPATQAKSVEADAVMVSAVLWEGRGEATRALFLRNQSAGGIGAWRLPVLMIDGDSIANGIAPTAARLACAELFGLDMQLLDAAETFVRRRSSVTYLAEVAPLDMVLPFIRRHWSCADRIEWLGPAVEAELLAFAYRDLIALSCARSEHRVAGDGFGPTSFVPRPERREDHASDGQAAAYRECGALT